MWPFRCQKLSFCADCDVAFKPRAQDTRYGGLCLKHMVEQRNEDRNRDRVMEWAWRTWEQLTPTAEAYWRELDRDSPNSWMSRSHNSWRGK